MGLLRRVLAAIVASHVVYLSVDSVTLFSLHPTCMSIGFLVLLGEGIVSLSNKEILSAFKRQNKVSVHWIIQVLALTCISVGFLAIYQTKNNYGKEHFTTPHGFLGMCAVLSCWGASMGGTAALYSGAIRSVIAPAQMKKIHGFFGTVAFTLGLVALLGGLRSDWFISAAGETVSLAHVVIVAVYAYLTIRVPVGNYFAKAQKK